VPVAGAKGAECPKDIRPLQSLKHSRIVGDIQAIIEHDEAIVEHRQERQAGYDCKAGANGGDAPFIVACCRAQGPGDLRRHVLCFMLLSATHVSGFLQRIANNENELHTVSAGRGRQYARKIMRQWSWTQTKRLQTTVSGWDTRIRDEC
jgi:hypothetical protein